MIRPSKRQPDELRPISIIENFTKYAEGSVLICFGETKVLCTASIEDRVPGFLRGKKKGWLTAEYSMLPRSTHERMQREVTKGKPSGRTSEIQRLIGRSLRSCLDMSCLGERTITLDCDVIQADGGTRTASITGAYVALSLAVKGMMAEGKLASNPIQRAIASVSVGVYGGAVVTDLDYAEDSSADTDMNLVMDNHGSIIEIQGTAEKEPFTRETLNQMLEHGQHACEQLFQIQQSCLSE